jgi:hypothetical protein
MARKNSWTRTLALVCSLAIAGVGCSFDVTSLAPLRSSRSALQPYGGDLVDEDKRALIAYTIDFCEQVDAQIEKIYVNKNNNTRWNSAVAASLTGGGAVAATVAQAFRGGSDTSTQTTAVTATTAGGLAAAGAGLVWTLVMAFKTSGDELESLRSLQQRASLARDTYVETARNERSTQQDIDRDIGRLRGACEQARVRLAAYNQDSRLLESFGIPAVRKFEQEHRDAVLASQPSLGDAKTIEVPLRALSRAQGFSSAQVVDSWIIGRGASVKEFYVDSILDRLKSIGASGPGSLLLAQYASDASGNPEGYSVLVEIVGSDTAPPFMQFGPVTLVGTQLEPILGPSVVHAWMGSSSQLDRVVGGTPYLRGVDASRNSEVCKLIPLSQRVRPPLVLPGAPVPAPVAMAAANGCGPLPGFFFPAMQPLPASLTPDDLRKNLGLPPLGGGAATDRVRFKVHSTPLNVSQGGSPAVLTILWVT